MKKKKKLTFALKECCLLLLCASALSYMCAQVAAATCAHRGLFSLFFSLLGLLFSQKGLSQGYEICCGDISHKNIRFGVRKKIGGPSTPRGIDFLGFF